MRRLARGGETSRQQTRRRPSVWDTRKLHDPAVMRRDRAAHRRIDSIRPAANARLISCAGNFLRDRIGELLGARRVRALRAVALASSHRSHLIRLSSLRSPPDFSRGRAQRGARARRAGRHRWPLDRVPARAHLPARGRARAGAGRARARARGAILRVGGVAPDRPVVCATAGRSALRAADRRAVTVSRRSRTVARA